MMRGQLMSVTRVPAGVEVLTAVAAGTRTVSVLSALDVDERGGALLALPDGSTAEVSSADHEAATVTLAQPLPVPLADGDWLTIPDSVEVVATVAVDGEPIDGVTVPHHLRPLLPDRFEQLEDGVSVLFDVDSSGGLSITDVLDAQPAEQWGDEDGAGVTLGPHGIQIFDLDETTAERYDVLARNGERLAAAQTRLTAAETRLNDAFSEIDLKPDKAYVDAAEQQAKDWAAVKAQQEADEAEAAARAYAEEKAGEAYQQAAQGLSTARTQLEQAIADGDSDAIAAANQAVLAARAELEQTIVDAATDARDAAILKAAQDATEKANEVMSKATAALDAAQAAQATADNAIRTYYSANPPWPNGSSQPDDVLGDMWYDDDSGQAYRWNGSSWIVIVDQTIGQALAAAQNAQTTADGKISGFYQPTEPLEADEGDLWYDTDDSNKPYARKNGQWVSIADLRIAAQAATLANIQQDITGLEGTLDGKSNVWVQSAQPTGLTAADKGDIWINDGASPRTTKVWNGTSWVDADSRITQAVADVAKKITTYYTATTTAPTGTFVEGDLWIDVNGKIARRQGNAWVTVSDPKARADAALAAAKADATAKADAAREAAKTAAAADATAKAEAAEAAAAQTAAADATAKANQAKADAEAAAKTYADTVASGASGDALSAAKTYAEQQAAAAELAAKNAAALDATAKAEAAQAEAARLAALDATAKANAAQAAAIAGAEAARKANHGYLYRRDVVVYGDSDKFYPVTIMSGDQNLKRDILIKRSYSEQAPPDWYNATHKGGLTVLLKANFGGWGGANYSWEIHELEELYSNTFGGALNVFSNMGFAVMLRGGGTTGAIYHMFSDQPLDSKGGGALPVGQVYYNSDLVRYFDDPQHQNYDNPVYKWNMPAPRETPLAANWVEVIRRRKFIKLAQDTDLAVQQQAAALAKAQGDIVRVEGKADGKANIYVQTTAPTGMGALDQGDIWIDTSGGQRVTKVWSGSAWQEADTRTAEALASVSTKIVTYFQPAAPTGTGFTVGDLWVNSTGKIARWSGSAWVDLVDPKTLADNAETNAKNAAQGWVDQVKNTSLTGVTVEYAVGSSETVAPTTGWSASTPTRTPGTFTWYRSTSTRGDGSAVTTNPALLTGNTGAPGAPGAAAPLVYLTATAQALVSPAAGGATTPATAQVVGSAVNTTITAWTYSVNGAAFSATVPAGVSRSGNTVTITGSTMTAKTVTVRMADAAGVADTATVAKVADGAAGTPGSDGAPGAAGADAYTVVLSNEAHTFAGSTTAALAGSTTSSVIAYKGATQMAATVGTITGQVTGLTTSIASNGGTAPVITITATTALTTRNGTLTVPVTVDGKVFTKTIAWAVSYTGSTGATGVSVSSVTPYFRTVTAGAAAPAAPTGAAPAAPWQSTEPAYAAGLDLYRSDRIAFSNGTTTYTPVTLVSSYTAAKVAEDNAKAYALAQTDGLAKTAWSSIPPGTTKLPKGSIWYQLGTSGAENGKIIAVWEQTWDLPSTWWAPRQIRSEVIDNLDVGKLTAAGGTIDDLVANVFAAKLADIIEANIGKLTVTGDTHLNTVVAQRIWGDIASFVQITADRVLAGNVQAVWNIIAGGRIVAGDPMGRAGELDDEGLTFYDVDPDGQRYASSSLGGPGADQLSMLDPAGNIIAGFTEDGQVVGTGLSVTGDAYIDGRPLVGSVDELGLLDERARGVVARQAFATSSPKRTDGLEYGYGVVSFRALGRRLYRIVTNAHLQPGTTTGVLRCRHRVATGGNAAMVTSEEDGIFTTGPGYSSNTAMSVSVESFVGYAEDTDVEFLFTYQGLNNGQPTCVSAEMYAEDVGPQGSYGAGVYSTGRESTPVVSKKTWTSTWYATDSATYRESGSKRTDSPDLVQGYTAYASGYGHQQAAVVFTGAALYGETTKSITQALAGATVDKVEVYLYFNHWYSSSGGTARIGKLGAASIPSTLSASPTKTSAGWPRGAGRWVTVPTSWFSDTNRGITLGGGSSTSSTFYGRADDHTASGSRRPKVRITYTR